MDGAAGRPGADAVGIAITAPAPASVLVVDDDPRVRTLLATWVRRRGCVVETAADPNEALDALARNAFDVVFADAGLADAGGHGLLDEVHRRHTDAVVVLTADHGTIPEAVDAIRAGAYDYVAKPLTDGQIDALLERLPAIGSARRDAPAPPSLSEACALLESSNPAMQRTIATARQVAASDAAVLLVGESGTGKRVLAEAIHAWSPRRAGPFVTISCATGGDRVLDAACGGTLFLDEVGDLPLDAQARILSALSDPRFAPYGRDGASAVDARVVTATKHRLDAEVRAGRFREDLFFRLNVVTLALPPLRERREDVESLTDDILRRVAVRHRRSTPRLDPEVRRLLAAYRWPGNVRELVNTLERAVVLSDADVITPDELPEQVLAPCCPGNTEPVSAGSLEDLERKQIARAMAESDTLEEAATRLGINPSTLWRKRKRYGFE